MHLCWKILGVLFSDPFHTVLSEGSLERSLDVGFPKRISPSGAKTSTGVGGVLLFPVLRSRITILSVKRRGVLQTPHPSRTPVPLVLRLHPAVSLPGRRPSTRLNPLWIPQEPHYLIQPSLQIIHSVLHRNFMVDPHNLKNQASMPK